MPSPALDRWRHDRAARLDRLIEAHTPIRGRQISEALVLHLVAEFQGFARDLHDDLRAEVRRAVQPSGNGISTIVSLALDQPRQLDRGNATPGALSQDFDRFGIRLWSELQGWDVRSTARRAHLDRLIGARNAIAHGDERKLRRLREEEGVRVTLSAVRGWRRMLDQLAAGMDAIVAAYFEAHFDRRPWGGPR